jgi:enoyl-CoA hydratase
MTSNYRTFSFNLTNGIGHLVLDRPPANQMTLEFFSEFNRMVDELRMMNDLKALVISSSGRHFSSGADLDELMELADRMPDSNGKVDHSGEPAIFEKNCSSFLFFEETSIPVISAIRGVCIGSAFELTLFGHFRFCGEDAVFGLPETTFNLVPGIGGISRMEAHCGTAKAIELVLKGNTFGAWEALNYNLVDRIIPKRRVVDFALAFAGKIMEGYKKQKAPLYLQRIEPDEPQFN